MESTQEVEVELEEIATAEEKENKESREKKEEEGNVYSSLSQATEYEYGVPSSTRSYTVNKDIHRKVRVYRIISLVLFVICVLLLIVVVVLFFKLTGSQPCQDVDPADRTPLIQECSLKKCQDMYYLTLPHERSQCQCGDCDIGWLKFENSCYFLSKYRLTWQEGREECQKRGGDLAIITNERLQSYLTENGNLRYWIGLSQAGRNQWTWNNNIGLTVRYFGDKFSDGDCALLAANEPPERSWHQSACTLSLHYICQKPKS